MKKININPILILLPVITIFLFYPLDETKIIQEPGSINRIISLSPAITRMIIDLDSENLLVGVTSFHPPLSRNIEIVGTLVQPNIEKIVILKPDIVFISEEDNKIQLSEMIKATNIPTFTFTRNNSFEKICEHYSMLAKIIGKEKPAFDKIKIYKQKIDYIKTGKTKKSIALFVSNEPLISASDKSYIGRMISDAGGLNALGFLDQHYPKLSLEHLINLNPDIIISILYHGDTYQTPFDKILMDFPNLTVMKRKSMYILPFNAVCYYTPGDYVIACSQIYEIIQKEIIKDTKFIEKKI